MIKIAKLACLAFTILLVSCHNTNTENYALVNVETFENAIANTPNIQLVDVRTPQEFEKGSIAQAINIDCNDAHFTQNINALNKSESVYIYCLSGGRSKKAADKLIELGFENVVELEGGYLNWSKTHTENAKKDQYSVADFNKMTQTEPVVLVDFYADWCGPCKKMAPYIEQFKTDYKEQVKVLKIDADQNKQLVANLGYEALPIVLIFKNGELVFENQGFVSEKDLRELLDKQL